MTVVGASRGGRGFVRRHRAVGAFPLLGVGGPILLPRLGRIVGSDLGRAVDPARGLGLGGLVLRWIDAAFGGDLSGLPDDEAQATVAVFRRRCRLGAQPLPRVVVGGCTAIVFDVPDDAPPSRPRRGLKAFSCRLRGVRERGGTHGGFDVEVAFVARRHRLDNGIELRPALLSQTNQVPTKLPKRLRA